LLDNNIVKNLRIGIDVMSIKRFKKLPYQKNKLFYKKIFSQSEIDYCLARKNSSQNFAGKFAIKEAVIKSISDKIRLSDIITSHKKSRPVVALRNNHSYLFSVSVSHDAEIAVAIVLSIKINSR